MVEYIQEVITEDINVDTTFKSGYQYIITNYVNVNANLTIENGSLISILNGDFNNNGLGLSYPYKVLGDVVNFNSVDLIDGEYVKSDIGNNCGLSINGSLNGEVSVNIDYKFLNDCKREESKCYGTFFKVNVLNLDNIGSLYVNTCRSSDVHLDKLNINFTFESEFNSPLNVGGGFLNLKSLTINGGDNQLINNSGNASISVVCEVNLKGNSQLNGLGIRQGAKAVIDLTNLQSNVFPQSSNLYGVIGDAYVKNVKVNKKTIFNF